MEFKCANCGSNASRILVGTDDRQYAKCLECGEIQLLDPPNLPQALASEPSTPAR